MFLVPPSIQAERLKICKECKFAKKTALGLFCGTPLIGDTIPAENNVTFYRKKIKLCGCKMQWKTKYKTASCPAGRWEMYKLTREEGKELKAYMESIDGQTTFPFEDLQKLGRWAFKVSDDRKYLQTTQCPSCVADMINNLRKLTEHL